MAYSTQERILSFIKTEIKQKGYPPSIREIGDAVGLSSSSTVHGHLDRLERKGLIRRDSSIPRGIDVLNWRSNEIISDQKFELIPIVGKVTAGVPITAVENIEDYFPVSKSNSITSAFMLRVQGESMIMAGIFDGDLVIVRQQPDAENGEIVVALTENDEATVKTFYREKGIIRLQPQNPDMEPMYYNNVRILGKVIGVIRDFLMRECPHDFWKPSTN